MNPTSSFEDFQVVSHMAVLHVKELEQGLKNGTFCIIDRLSYVVIHKRIKYY